MKLFSYTFGCQMNLADSEEMSRPLRAKGFSAAATLEEADCVLVNTCTIRDHAEHKAWSLLGRLEEWKAEPGRMLIVAGCAAQHLGDKIQERFPYVDLVVGARSIEQYPELLEAALKSKWPSEDAAFSAEQRPPVPPPGALAAHITVMRGCNYTCSYCIVPAVRGRESYRPKDEILAEARAHAERGGLEVNLVGQTVNSWKHGGEDFADLLRSVAAVPGLLRVRFISPHPFFLNERLARAMAETPNVSPHMHLPVQSGSDRILKAMRRNYTAESYLEKLAMLRSIHPEVAVTTDFIVGFPSETDEDFRLSLELFDRADFDAAYCFKYSPREGTEAALHSGQVPEELKEERLARLLDFAEARAKDKAGRQIGKTVEVLLEDPQYGRTGGYLKMRLEAPAAGPLAKAVVTGAQGALLIGREAPLAQGARP